MIDHAKRRIEEFKGEAKPFLDSVPYAGVMETNADDTEATFKFRLAKPMPKALSGIAFDAANSLRSALDQAGHACAVASGKSGRKAGFPFGDDQEEAESRIFGPSKNIPKEIFDFMISLKPYKGGNDLLWALNKLANTNKHALIVPTAIAMGSGTASLKSSHFPIEFSGPPVWDRSKNEFVVLRVPRKSKLEYYLQLQTFIAFDEFEGIGGQQVIGVLNAMASVVESSIAGIEAEARHIGLFH
jgi:hypothetical protein